MTLRELSQSYNTRKFRCRRVSDLQDFFVLGPTKCFGDVVSKFSIVNLDTGLYYDANALGENFVMLSNNVELGFINRLGEPQMLKAIRARYPLKG